MLRVGLILPPAPPLWVADCVRRVSALPNVRLAFASVVRAPSARRASWAWRRYRRLDDRLSGRAPDMLRPADLDDVLQGVPSHSSQGEDAGLPDPACDLLLHFGDGEPCPEWIGAARHGLWRLRFGGCVDIAPSVIGLRESLDRAPSMRIELLHYHDRCPPRVIDQRWVRRVPFFLRKNRDNMLRKCADLLARQVRALQLDASVTPLARDEIAQMRALGEEPGTLETVVVAARLGAQIGERVWQKLRYVEQWFVAFRFDDAPGLPRRFDGYTEMHPPADRFWADPFPMRRNGAHYIFLEELPFASNKGHIAVSRVGPDGTWSVPQPVLTRDYHLSYPFLLDWQGVLYMIPESGHNRTVELYRCHRFPDDWRLEAVLLEDVNCADATLQFIGDRWWMFVTIGEPQADLYDALHLYHAPRPTGPWRAHPRNPVKLDVRSARPAGRLFPYQGQIYRPAQCCAPLYGSALTLNRIERIDAEHYSERVVATLTPDWRPGLLGLHTFNRCEGLTVIDAFQRTPRFAARGSVRSRADS